MAFSSLAIMLCSSLKDGSLRYLGRPTMYTSGNRRSFCTILSIISAGTVLALVTYSLWVYQPMSTAVCHHILQDAWFPDATHISELSANSNDASDSTSVFSSKEQEKSQLPPDPLDSKSVVVGPPTESFRANLRNDTKYISSWTSAGWTNDVMTFGNLIYLAMITDRVPIIPQFTASGVHMDPNINPVPFGDIFNISLLAKAIGLPVLQWHEVKDVDSQHVDELGCWSIWETVSQEGRPRPSPFPDYIHTDISYTPAPSYVKLLRDQPLERFSTFWSLATLAFPDTRPENLMTPRPSPLHSVQIPPDDHLVCYDYMYYVCAQWQWEFEYGYSPLWNKVLVHMRWTDRLTQIVDEHARRTLSTPASEPLPPWIAIHVRHTDFRDHCGGSSDCFPPLSDYNDQVREIQAELLEHKGIEVKHVIMTSDETDPEWWAGVAGMGWKRVDYAAQRTEEIYGPWYPIFIDAVIQSEAAGFVGTHLSTMSLIAGRRLETWHDGVVREVMWESPTENGG